MTDKKRKSGKKRDELPTEEDKQEVKQVPVTRQFKLITSEGARTQTLRMVPGSLRHQVMVGQSAIYTSKRFLRGASAADPHAAQTHNKVRNQRLSGASEDATLSSSFPTAVDETATAESRIIWLFQDKRLQTSKPGLRTADQRPHGWRRT